jgi:hypothetical protein
MDERDTDAYTHMAWRLELTQLWTELAGMLCLGYVVPSPQRRNTWRAYPLARTKGQEVHVTDTTSNCLRCVTGQQADVYTTEQVQATAKAALNMLKVYTHRVEA